MFMQMRTPVMKKKNSRAIFRTFKPNELRVQTVRIEVALKAQEKNQLHKESNWSNVHSFRSLEFDIKSIFLYKMSSMRWLGYVLLLQPFSPALRKMLFQARFVIQFTIERKNDVFAKQ